MGRKRPWGLAANGILLISLPVLSSFAQEGRRENIIQYKDIAPHAGIAAGTVVRGAPHKDFLLGSTGGPVALLDYDGDGWLDIYLLNGWAIEGFIGKEAPFSHLYQNNGDGTFTDVSERTGAALQGWAQGVCAGDYNNDGLIDLFVTFYGGSKLLRNEGGHFVEIPGTKSGILTTKDRWNTGCSFIDYDRDADLDLFVANYVLYEYGLALYDSNTMANGVSPILAGVEKLKGSHNLLYRNDGDGTFEDVSAATGITKPEPDHGFTPVAVDYNNDGWPDIFLANDSTPNRLYRNEKDGTFSEVGLLSGVAYNEDGRAFSGMGADAGDYDLDGLLDLVVTNFSNQTTTLYKNVKGEFFIDTTFPAGVGDELRYVKWGTHFFDFDADTRLDLFIAAGAIYPPGIRTGEPPGGDDSPSLLYWNVGDGRLKNISTQAGSGLPIGRSSRGSAVGDLFNQGQLEIVINNINDLPVVLKNRLPLSNHWIGIRLIGNKTNRAAIGSRVLITVGGVTQVREVRSGGSFCSQNDLRLLFGLGKSKLVDSLEVRWLSGEVERFQQVEADRYLTIEEGKGIVQ